jgi:hypothetical protein
MTAGAAGLAGPAACWAHALGPVATSINQHPSAAIRRHDSLLISVSRPARVIAGAARREPRAGE